MSRVFIDSFVQGQYVVKSKSGKQVLFFEDSDQFGPSKLDPRKNEPSPMADKSWFWDFYDDWRSAGRPTSETRSTPHGPLLVAVWPTNIKSSAP